MCMKVFMFLCFALLLEEEVWGGCCNENYWCDGDPSFRRQPTIRQNLGAETATVSWTSAYLHLPKCVDYYFVEYFESDDGIGTIPKIVPVRFEHKEILDEWDDPVKPLTSRYSAVIPVQPNTNYTISVVAVDKGSGWGEMEGKAMVYTRPIFFHSRSLIAEELSAPDTAEIVREEIERKYPPHHCSETRFCDILVMEWLEDIWKAIRDLSKHDPEFLPAIDVRKGDSRRRYEEGHIHGLSRVSMNVSSSDMDIGHLVTRINVTLHFRLLRVSYLWYSFFSYGNLSLYHTCGHELPMNIFQDLKLGDMDESIPSDCSQTALVTLAIPLYPSRDRPRVNQVHFRMRRRDYVFDIHWLFSHFHNLDQIWLEEQGLVQNKVVSLLRAAFEDGFEKVHPQRWLRKKYKYLQEQVAIAKELGD